MSTEPYSKTRQACQRELSKIGGLAKCVLYHHGYGTVRAGGLRLRKHFSIWSTGTATYLLSRSLFLALPVCLSLPSSFPYSPSPTLPFSLYLSPLPYSLSPSSLCYISLHISLTHTHTHTHIHTHTTQHCPRTETLKGTG